MNDYKIYFTWLVFAFFSYSLGYFLKKQYSFKKLEDIAIDQIKSVTLIATLIGVIFLVLESPLKDIGMGLITFASVSFGIWISNENQKKVDLINNKKTMKIFLSSLLNELSLNLHILDTIKPNYRFFTTDVDAVILSVKKFNKMAESTSNFQNDMFVSFNTSKAIQSIVPDITGNSIESDELLHIIWTSYKEIFLIKTYFQQLSANFDLKLKTAMFLAGNPIAIEKLPTGWLDSFQDDLKAGGVELAKTRRFLINSLKILKKHLSNLGIKTEIELREGYVEDEDKLFIDNIFIRPTDIEINKPFKKPEIYDNPI